MLHPDIQYMQQCHIILMYCFIVNDLLFGTWWKMAINVNICLSLFFIVCISICVPCWLAGSCSASSAFNTFTSAVTSIHRSRSLSVCLLLTVHCVIWGSFQCDVEICKSALLVLSISDRIILKQHAACLPVCPLLLPQLIRLTEALPIWPQQLFQAFPQYHDQTKQAVIQKSCPLLSSIQ